MFALAILVGFNFSESGLMRIRKYSEVHVALQV